MNLGHVNLGQRAAFPVERPRPLRIVSALLVITGLLAAACTAAPTPSVSAPTLAPAAATAATATPAPAAAAGLKFPGDRVSGETGTERTDVRVPILGAVPNAPPRAPAPAATGPTPPPPVPPPAKIVQLYAHVDTVTAGPGESKYFVDSSLSCVKTSVFSRGMRIVWRMEIVDATTGKVLQGADVQRALLKLPNGEEATFRYGRHGPLSESPWYLTATWDIPMTYPLGTLDYGIEITTVAGKSLSLKDPLAMSLPARGMDTRVQIVN